MGKQFVNLYKYPHVYMCWSSDPIAVVYPKKLILKTRKAICTAKFITVFSITAK